MTDQLTLDFTEPQAQLEDEPAGPGAAGPRQARLRLLSFDLRADFGFFKKPDVNEGLQLSYNMLHKPALLGILGAIAGLKGYQQKGQWPEYYRKLQSVRVGFEPLRHERGNFQKTTISYTNTVGYANADGTLIVHESTLRSPAYRVYVLLNEADDVQARLLTRIQNGEAEYVPYLGKNEFTAWWKTEEVRVYEVALFTATGSFRISSLFIREYPLRSQRVKPRFSPAARGTVDASTFIYFERLPVGFDETLRQYELAEFAYTDWVLRDDAQIDDLYQVRSGGEEKIIQLF
jgi:CRISPR-associated protein Cas5h